MVPSRPLRITRFAGFLPAISSIFVAALAVFVLVGWTFDIEFFKSLLHPNRISMNPMSAVLMLLSATALWVVRDEAAQRAARNVVCAGLVIVLFVAASRLCDVVGWTRFGLDELLFRSRLDGNSMSPNTALAFCLYAAGMLFLAFSERDRFHAGQILIILAGSVGLLSLTGYLYRSTDLYGIRGFVPMALNTSIAFLMLALGALASRPQREPMAGLLSDTLGGIIARRLVPAAFIVPLVAGRLEILAVRHGVFDADFGLAILVIANILVFNILIWWCAGAMRSSDLRRRISEEAMRNSEERHRAITEQAAEGIYLVDMETRRIVDSNAAMERLLGYAHGEAESKTVYDFVADSRENIDMRLDQLAKSEEAMYGHRQYRRKDGTLIDVEASAAIISIGGRKVACTVAHDITARIRAEEQMRSSEARLRLIIETANDAFVAMDSDGKIVDWNPHAEQTFGWTRSEAVGRVLADTIVPEQFRVAHREGLRHFLATGSGPVLGKRLELTGLHRDEHEFPIEMTISPARVGAGFVFFAFIHDITARKRAEEERDRFFTLSSDMVAVGGFDGYFKRVNPAFQKALGYTSAEMLAKPWLEFVHPDDVERTIEEGLKILEGGNTTRFENRYLAKNGEYRWLSWTSVPVVNEGLIYAIARDMTESKRAQQELEEAVQSEREALRQLKATQSQLVQSEKLAGLGQMVAGVAHEINNPLSFVSNNIAVLQRDIRGLTGLLALYSQADEVIAQQNAQLLAEIRDLAERMDLQYTQTNMRELLERSREGMRRIQQIVKDLRDFARLDESDLHEVDLNAGIQSTVNIVLGKAKKKRVQVDLELGPLPMVACFPAKINQVVMNLVSNAIDASPEGGHVFVKSEMDGDGIHISVSDQGPGVPPAIRDRIFDPFFTTKAIGEGTGLGLSISYGIVHDHGGTIELTDSPMGGALFIVHLPKRCEPQTATSAK